MRSPPCNASRSLQRGLSIAAEDRTRSKTNNYNADILQRGLSIAAEDR